MGKIVWKTKEEINNEIIEKQKQEEIELYKKELSERYNAFYKLLATDATQTEISECKKEIKDLIQSLEVLRNGTTTTS